jgi:charged multivesicular body protein 3
MQKMAMHVAKAGLIEEMIDDTMEEMEPEELDDLADEEVKNVVEELLGAKFIGASTAGLAAPVLPEPQVQVPAASAAETDLEKRLKAL